MLEVIDEDGETEKLKVLKALKSHLFSHKTLKWVYVHYKGHATIEVTYKRASEAGRWCCGNNEYICIEDVIEVCDLKCRQ